ncbi:hypothetical protein FRC01_005539 [Tulasnella sp. 417]|nr:hypothetical protein FRC01_005539 [Tulasnella sp. 417]
MCYEYGTLDQATANCIVCKLLGTNKANCPHKSQLRVCQDRQNHSQPIVFYTNAEYNIFNGCGYCKWAKRFAQAPDFDKLNNKGWPGCCRPPRLGEMELIDDTDWPVVSRRYGLPDRSALRDRPQRPVSLSKAASRSGSSARRGSIEVRVCVCYAESNSGSSSSSSASSVSSFDPRTLRDIHKDFEKMSLSSTSSNRESIITVTSDGAFTDYLSDESEAELQRQAEARAAQLRRLRAEEAEFNAAKRGLANIDLQTPIAWNPTQPQPYNPSSYARR